MQKAWSSLVVMILFASLTTAAPPHPASGATRQHNLMPVPASLEFTAGKLALNEAFAMAVSNHHDERLQAAINRMARRLEGRTGFAFARALASDTNAATPKAAIELVIVPALRQLVIAAAEIEHLQTATPTEWVERVKAAAQPPKRNK